MKRELSIAVAAATILAGVAGCAGGNKAPVSSSSSATAASSTPAAPDGATKVIVGGQPQNVTGPVVCSTTDGRFSIAIGDVITGVIIGLEPDASAVHNAGLGSVDGVIMNFTEGVPGENASATKTGNIYKITGTASGVDSTGQQVHKPFEVNVTCP
jgi:lipoprotein LpqH